MRCARRSGAGPLILQTVVLRPFVMVVMCEEDARHAPRDLHVMQAAAVRDELVPVVERDAVTRIGQHFRDCAVHFDEFFLGHAVSFFLANPVGEPCSDSRR